MRNDGPLWPERAAHYADNALAIGNGCVPLSLSLSPYPRYNSPLSLYLSLMAMRDRAGMTTHKKASPIPFSLLLLLSLSNSVFVFFFGGDELLFKWTLRILPPYLDSRAIEQRSQKGATRAIRDGETSERGSHSNQTEGGRPLLLLRLDGRDVCPDRDRFVWLQTEASSGSN